jgi:hypothetical protein
MSKRKRGERKMKRIILTSPLLFVLFFWITSANATLLNPQLTVPDIVSNQTGGYSFSNGLLTFEATPLSITFDGVTFSNIENSSSGNRLYMASFFVDASGKFAGGVPARDDLVIVGAVGAFDGTLLTGEVTDFGWFDVPGPQAIFDFTFGVTGGLLESFWAGGIGGDIAVAQFSTFTGCWEVNHQGTRVRHDTAAVPEPSAILLVGTGLVGLAGFRRKSRPHIS